MLAGRPNRRAKIVLEVLLAAANVGDEPNDPGVTLGPRLERARPQAALEARGQHGNAGVLDDLPYAHEDRRLRVERRKALSKFHVRM